MKIKSTREYRKWTNQTELKEKMRKYYPSVVECLNTSPALYQIDWLITITSIRLKTSRVDLISWTQ